MIKLHEMDNTKPKLWILTELFYPDQTSTSFIISKIADKMADKYDVMVITDSYLYQENKFSAISKFQINKEIKVLRVKSKKSDKNNLVQRTGKVTSLSFKLAKALWKNACEGEKVLIVTNPAPLLVLLSCIKKIKKFQLYVLVYDVFPENTIPSGIFKSCNSILYKIISSIFNRAYSVADGLIVLGRDMKKVVEVKVKDAKRKPSVKIIENWADIEGIRPYTEKPEILKERYKDSFITIQYAGNIGRVQGLERFLALFNLSSNKHLYFDLWGNGALFDQLNNWAIMHKIDNRVHFHGSYSREDQNEILNSTDLAIVTLSKGMYGLGVPSKTYNILAAGKPILFIGDLDSEIALLIKEEEIGFCFSPEDDEGTINFLNSLTVDFLPELEAKGRKARIVAERQFSEEKILSKYLEMI